MATSKKKEVKPVEQTNSKKTIMIIIGILVVLAGFAYYANITRSSSDTTPQVEQAKTDEKSSQDTQAQKKSDDTKIEAAKKDAEKGKTIQTVAVESDSSYRYVAGNGDSYTVLARRAVEKASPGMSIAQRVAAETKLAQEASAQYLDVGQEVTIKKSAVEAAVSWAKSLSAEQKSAWQYYADQVAW